MGRGRCDQTVSPRLSDSVPPAERRGQRFGTRPCPFSGPSVTRRVEFDYVCTEYLDGVISPFGLRPGAAVTVVAETWRSSYPTEHKDHERTSKRTDLPMV